MSTRCAQLPGVAPVYQERARSVLSSLRSYFLELPRGTSFCDREDFERAYRVLRKATRNGEEFTGEALLSAIEAEPRAWLVLRAVTGLSPGELAHLVQSEAASRGIDLELSQNDAREIEARAKRGRQLLFEDAPRGARQRRYDALVRTVVPLIAELLMRPVQRKPDRVHRLQKYDTVGGRRSLAAAFAADKVPYSELLYERLLGRPFASHRDAVAGVVGRIVEEAIEALLDRYAIDGRAILGRRQLPDFPQAPDFVIPSTNPEVIIEAKLSEDDGTARDKVARVQALASYERRRKPSQRRKIIAVIDGRGFGHRLADLNRLLEACEGRVYTLSELERLVDPDGPLHPYVGTKGAQP